MYVVLPQQAERLFVEFEPLTLPFRQGSPYIKKKHGFWKFNWKRLSITVE